jgi:hypothetical protein
MFPFNNVFQELFAEVIVAVVLLIGTKPRERLLDRKKRLRQGERERQRQIQKKGKERDSMTGTGRVLKTLKSKAQSSAMVGERRRPEGKTQRTSNLGIDPLTNLLPFKDESE